MIMTDAFTTYYHSPVGLLKITGSEEYISEVSFHDTSHKAEGNKKHLPPMLINCVEQMIQYFNGHRRIFELPLHQQGTAFQQDVWSILTQIPFGKTISYLELARKTGDTAHPAAQTFRGRGRNCGPGCRTPLARPGLRRKGGRCGLRRAR